jgi:hypothetical protein
MEIGQGNGLIVFNSEGQELTLRERNLSNFMYTNNSIFNTTITNKNESSVDIANQEDAFPPLTDNHIEYRNEKEKPSSSSSEVWSDNYYQSLNVHSNSTSNDDRYYSEDDQSEGIDHTEDGQRDYEISYVEELQYDDIDRCADDDQVSYIIYSESDDEYIDHYLSVEGLLGLDIYEDNEGNNNEDDNNEDDDKEVYYQALLNDADSYKYLLTEDLPDEDLPDEDLPDEDLPDEDLSNEDWTEEEWDHHVRLRKQKHYIS